MTKLNESVIKLKEYLPFLPEEPLKIDHLKVDVINTTEGEEIYSNDDEQCFGLFSAAKMTILLDPYSMTREKYCEVLVHECFHAYLYARGLSNMELDEERQCSIFGSIFIKLCEDNPSILKYIYNTN